MRRILVLDDDRENVEYLNGILSQEGHSIQAASDAEAALHRIKAWKPQLLLLNVNQPAPLLRDLILKVRAACSDDYLAIILLVGQTATVDMGNGGLDLGADDYLMKPFRSHELITRIRTMLHYKDTQDLLRRANHRIEEISSTDDLTGLMNMRTLHRKGEEEVLRSRRFKKPVSALLINLDRFSDINHKLGFQTGSAVLQDMGARIKNSLRSIDMVARVGADEFFVLLVETDLANAEFMAERIRDGIQSQAFRDQKHAAELTTCIGVAGLNFAESEGDNQQHISDLFHFASEALRSAKAAGPNRIEIYSFA
jgi:two-component system, cell cycle response regulator